MVDPAEDFLTTYQEQVWNVYGYFAYRGLRSADAEDLTQLTFERAWKAWDRFDPSRASLATWLLAIARNAYIDFRRRDRSGGHGRVSLAEVSEVELPSAEDSEAHLGLSPELARAVRRLGRREREVVALRFGSDLRAQEIAEMLGISVANAQQILSRAVRKMRQHVEQEARRPGSLRAPAS